MVSLGQGRQKLQEWWSLNAGCVERKSLVKEIWIRVVGLPLHMWTHDVLKMIGDGCGGFIAIDKETALGTKVLQTRISMRVKGKGRPSTVNILAGPRSFEVQVWWELQPWVASVYPSKVAADSKVQKSQEENACPELTVHGTSLQMGANPLKRWDRALEEKVKSQIFIAG